MHKCEIKNGKIHHYISGELRAVVDPDHYEEYRVYQPECPSLDELAKPAE